jgi:hypothetical protein
MAVADGHILSLAIRVNESPEKRIGISNYYLADMFPLFDLIDSILPPNHRIGYHDNAELLRKAMRGELEGEDMRTYWNGKEEVGEWEYCIDNRCYSLDLREDSTAVIVEPEGRSWSLTFTHQTFENDSLALWFEALIIQTRQTVDTVGIYKLTLDSMVTVGFPRISASDTVRFCRVRE